jgi:hypothetical protein
LPIFTDCFKLKLRGSGSGKITSKSFIPGNCQLLKQTFVDGRWMKYGYGVLMD